MIKNFTDLAANERTYLAWVRTAIAMMAFGFLIEKFQLFLRIMSIQAHIKQNLQSSVAVEALGLAMMVVSMFIMIGATVRYLVQRKHILEREEIGALSATIGFTLSAFLVIIALLLTAYLWLRVF